MTEKTHMLTTKKGTSIWILFPTLAQGLSNPASSRAMLVAVLFASLALAGDVAVCPGEGTRLCVVQLPVRTFFLISIF